ncbi:hypothetical protein CKO12_13415 [Chromatium okenii]|uniref:hypothetical protein n=1 Tax=Chromatium okenii TaxID=61644 RepID=UPI0019044827|nr:hypothetical protein [Chromatium okenii]MBK1642849.1 hypothetical protein [Chromatium okenii]
MDFFKPECQTGPFYQERFGLCDDQNTTQAYVKETDSEKWIATVENPARRPLIFTAIDKCVIQDADEFGRRRCDGMLTTESLLYLVELKNQKKHWEQEAIEQLESTIKFLSEHHDLSHFRTKKAFVCNKRHRPFATIDNALQSQFFQKYKFRIDVHAIVLVIPS